MFLLPAIMEFSGPPNSKPIEENKENTKKLNFYDYIYLMNENELLKFKVELNHMDVVNVLEKYIDSQKQFDMCILNEKDAKATKIPLKFLYYLGNYRLNNYLVKTKNYLVPEQTKFLNIITEKYKDSIIVSRDLNKLNNIMFDAQCDEDDVTQNLIDLLFDSVNVELVERFEMNLGELENTINNIRTLLQNSRECQLVLSQLKYILEESKTNKEYITKLGLEYKFNKAIEKQKQKVK